MKRGYKNFANYPTENSNVFEVILANNDLTEHPTIWQALVAIHYTIAAFRIWRSFQSRHYGVIHNPITINFVAACRNTDTVEYVIRYVILKIKKPYLETFFVVTIRRRCLSSLAAVYIFTSSAYTLVYIFLGTCIIRTDDNWEFCPAGCLSAARNKMRDSYLFVPKSFIS